MNGRQRLFLPLVFLAALLLLSGCGVAAADLDLTIIAGERYAWTLKLGVDQQTIQLTGVQAFEQQIQDYVDQAKQQGINLSWGKVKADRAGETAYELRASGQDYARLASDLSVTVEPTTYNNRQAVRVVIPASTVSSLMASRNSITLHGAEILTSNGNEIDRGTVRWSPVYQDATAVLIPKSQSLPTAAIVIVVILALAGVAVAAWRLWPRRMMPAPSLPPATVPAAGAGGAFFVPAKPADPSRFCPYCGEPLVGPGRFCMRCGREIPRRTS
jgi:hypothetical protein